MFSVYRWASLLLATLLAGTCAYSQVTINELIAENHTSRLGDGALSDWAELHNSSAAAVSLAGWSLTDTTANPHKWVFPNVTMAPGGYLVVALDPNRLPSSAAGGTLNAGFAIKATGDNLALYNPAGALVDSVRFGPQAADFSIGAFPSGSRSFVLCEPTPGGPNKAQALGAASALKINEWMASPSAGKDWFEIYNSSSLPVQLSGLYFADSGNAPSPIAPLSFIGVGQDGFLRFYADNSTNDNEVDFALGASGDAIGLYQANGAEIDRVQFGTQTQDISQGRLPDGSASIQALNRATPGRSNLVLYEGIWVNEVLSRTDPPFEDAVEFYNSTSADIDVSGWYLSNSRTDLMKYRLPAGRVIPAKGYLVIYENQFNGPTALKPFTFDPAPGDRVVLAQANASGALTGYIVDQAFDAAPLNTSIGRYQTSVVGESRFVLLQTPTFGVVQPSSVTQFRTGTGGANAAPLVGPIVISEIMYNPGSPLAPDATNDPDEYIELTNISASPVPLYDPGHATNLWKVAKGISYAFPAGRSIPAGATILLVSFDPADATQAAAFRAKYSVPPTVPLYGPFSGKLDNGGEEIALFRPDTPQASGFVPMILVDSVEYADVQPWPAEADGTGQSLQRKILGAFGNDAANWIAGPPAAGQSGNAQPDLTITSIRASARTVQITISAVAGRSYALQARNEFSPGAPWEPVTVAVATSSTLTFSDSAPGSKRFYRVVSPAGN